MAGPYRCMRRHYPYLMGDTSVCLTQTSKTQPEQGPGQFMSSELAALKCIQRDTINRIYLTQLVFSRYNFLPPKLSR